MKESLDVLAWQPAAVRKLPMPVPKLGNKTVEMFCGAAEN
jgi:hypothetical protein